ncbi:Type VI secretion protein [Alloalcanivorax dieselolei B5]|uniref:Type VI secretion protein n=1 Tax=Alcanivorax dieselolei (strain DSM 16502 / CGMCC 1.3690 / MCCC 1A00001 / B-5) TaxID=930169 RepID=K0CFR8_ALCDB|nr:type VI secretion system baseplate subunit TssF [Alloalcanivorax dieselolei]AFT70471.1 Type VI secretion protein [Alloalcanivorax dieselolei B5]GGJ84587.1 hypothetical protein GCM10007426_12070 [Alloalcanivorax dieselolei]
MRDLLPYYERELGFLRRYGKEFAERYPKIASRLLLSADVSEDPHVERLIESFALLSARISKKLDDDFPEFTDALLDVLYPHYLRPFPSCSIARFDVGNALSTLSEPLRIPRGTALRSRPVRGVNCRFRTAYDVTLVPIVLTEAVYRPVMRAPMAMGGVGAGQGQLSLRFELASTQLSFDTLGVDTIRLFTDGEPSFCAALRDALAYGIGATYVEADDSGRWFAVDQTPIRQVGFDDEESLIDYPSRSHPAYRLLTELFAFPEKFGFFDLDIKSLSSMASGSFTVHFALDAPHTDGEQQQLLEGLGRDNVLLGCSPVVNLFRQRGEPIHVHERQASYPVVADARNAFAHEIYSIDTVKRVRQTPLGEDIQTFRPFYSLHHGEDAGGEGLYWMARRDEELAEQSPGYETEITFVDLRFNPTVPKTDVVGLDLTCTNRDLPSHLAYGVGGGDLTMETDTSVKSITMLRKPSRPRRFIGGRNAHWRLISHLSLNHLSIAGSGLPALKEMLSLYDLSSAAVARRQIEGLIEVQHRPVTSWLPGRPFAAVARGVEINLTIDESSFVGTGLSAFVAALDRFFGLYVHANSFTQLNILSRQSNEVLIQCPPRSGESTLV